MKPLSPNTLLQNRYLVVHLIGKGGMGEVYLAVDQRLGSAVALKRTFFSDDESLGNAFEREARTLARLRHPVLPKVSDHFIENGNQYLVMDHISGDDLSKRLEATQKPFPLSWVLFWADQLLDALSYLHAHEPPILHRDIKPQNLKLTDENNIVLLDFGLAKNSLGETRISSSGSVGFTPHYAPMEQIRGTGTNPRSDIYSLSATLYQLLTNKVPPDALSRADKLLNDAPDPTEQLENLNAEVSTPIAEVIAKGMSVSQEQRFADAREMQKELRDAYSQIRNGAAEKSSAVSAAVQGLPEPVDPKGETEPIAPVSDKHPTPQSEVETQVMAFPPENLKQEIKPESAEKEEEDFDATLAFDPLATNGSGNETGAKTEILEVQQSAELIASEAPETAAENAVPALPVSEPQPAEVETVVRPSDRAPAAVVVTAEATAPVRAAKPEKKSGGKAVWIVGGLAVLLFLAVGAGAVGWYFYNRSAMPALETPTPEVSVTPTPAEILGETNANQGNIGEQITNSEIPANDTKTGPVGDSNSSKPTKKTDTAPKQTPKSTPKKNSRTDILQ